ALRAEPGFLDHFDHVTFSYELRSAKPEPLIYRHAVEGLQVAPKQALFLDDKQPNVDGAHALGLHAELFTSWEDFVAANIPQRYNLPIPS
ncbi:MAG: HAD-IA family hydrolase, partial [Acidobacteriota bacterium]